jgi:hypothetical protein
VEQRNFVSFDWPIDPSDEQREDYDAIPPGREIMERIRNVLASRGFDVTPVEQHKFYGWCFESSSGGATVWSMLQRPGPWLLISESRHSLLTRLFGKAQNEPIATVRSAIDQCLLASPEATGVQWLSRSEYSAQGRFSGDTPP